MTAIRRSGATVLLITTAMIGVAPVAVAKSPSRGAYRKQVDAICTTTDGEITKAIRKLYPSKGPQNAAEQAVAVVKILIPARDKQWKAIFALPVPKADRDKIAFIKELAAQELSALRRDPSTAMRSDPFLNTDLAWSDYGLKVCPAPIITER